MIDTPIADRIVQAAKRDMLNTYGGYNEAHARTTIVAVLRATTGHIEAHADSLPGTLGHWQEGRIDGLAEAVELISSALIDIEQQGGRYAD